MSGALPEKPADSWSLERERILQRKIHELGLRIEGTYLQAIVGRLYAELEAAENALCRNIKQLMERISFIHTEIESPVLIEEFIEGRELFVAVLGNERMEALPVLEWDFSKVKDGPKFATVAAKWDKDSEGYKAPEVFPEDIPEEVYKPIQATAVDACKALRIQDYGRVDMRLRQKKPKNGAPGEYETFIIEVNPNPYLEQRAEVAMAAKKQSLGFGDLCEKIIELAMRRSVLRT